MLADVVRAIRDGDFKTFCDAIADADESVLNGRDENGVSFSFIRDFSFMLLRRIITQHWQISSVAALTLTSQARTN